MRAVIYARYSSDQQRDASVEDQVRLCQERITAERWTLRVHFESVYQRASRRSRMTLEAA
jgi:DNA invertase Pin-like site-specific DNA recombinase